MKNIFTILLFLSLAVGFGQNNDAPKEDATLIKENTTEKSDETDYDQIYTSAEV